MSLGKRIIRKVSIGCFTVILLVLGFLFLTKPGQDIRTLVSHGFLEGYLSPEQSRKYNATDTTNLKALYTAMMQYHESEGQFPQAAGWMDAIKSYGAASDLAKGEADKKFVSPALLDNSGRAKAGVYGYAMNSAASGKYKGDVKDQKTPLIFDSSDTSRNAYGDPKKLLPSPARPGGNLAIAVDGTILKL